MSVRLVPASLLAGMALAVAVVATYQWWWGLALGVTAALALVLVTPAGWTTRLPLGLGFDVVVAVLAVPTGAGDYLVSSTTQGYVVLGLALVVLVLSTATLPRPGAKIPRFPGESTTLK